MSMFKKVQIFNKEVSREKFLHIAVVCFYQLTIDQERQFWVNLHEFWFTYFSEMSVKGCEVKVMLLNEILSIFLG